MSKFHIHRNHQDSSAQHGPRKQGALPSGDSSQGYGRPDGGTIWDHDSEHHADRRQRQPAPVSPE